MRAAADRRPGQFRLGRWRSARRHALHRSAPRQGRARADRRHRQGHGRIPATITTAASSEPVVLPARFPNLLVNGAGGIAVGMATNIPPHNLGEVIDACLAYIDDPSISMEALTEIVPGPDFPDRRRSSSASRRRARRWRAGRGSILMRARCTVEEIRKDREAIIVTEIPYQVNKARMHGAHRRTGARQARRRHRRHPRRKRPPRHARGDRAQARCFVARWC